MSSKRKGDIWRGGILGKVKRKATSPAAGSAFKPGQLVWLPAVIPPATTPLKDPSEDLFPFNLSAAGREEFERRGKENREKVVRMLGLAPDVSEEELQAAIRREQRLNERAGAKVRAGAKQGGRPRGSKKAALTLAEFKKRRPITPTTVSDSQLAVKIGKGFGLRKRASIEAIKPAKKPCRKPA